ncbi:MAG: hypothetical protein K2W95_30820 [Candidatus Obscuribacterales bacterium]|nr:hypothetical protein [Candidatus Obscuribacterales bacterium]
MKRVYRWRISGRSQFGGGIVLAVTFLVLFLAAGLPVFAFVANASAHMAIQADIRAIAAQTAQVMDDQQYWLEAPRPGVDMAKASGIAKAAASAMCQQVGLDTKRVRITYSTDASGGQTTVCELEVDATKRYPLRLNFPMFDMKSIFPERLTVQGSNEHSPLPPFALIHTDAPTRIDESTRTPLNFNQRDVAVLPAFGFFYKAVAGSTVPGPPYGKGIYQDLTPENFMAMNHYHLKKVDLERVLRTGQDVQLNGWHAERVYDGKPTAVPGN